LVYALPGFALNSSESWPAAPVTLQDSPVQTHKMCRQIRSKGIKIKINKWWSTVGLQKLSANSKAFGVN
jgi:hypothetical protein